MFLEDDKIMFLPKQPADILKALQMCGRNPYMKFSVQEIGIFEKMIEVLKPRSESEEQQIIEAKQFILDNSKPVQGHVGLQQFRHSMHPQSSDILLKDDKGRLCGRGTHRDIHDARAMRKSVNFPLQGSAPSSSAPMTMFNWEIPPVMVTSIPTSVATREEKFRYVAKQLKEKNEEIQQKRLERFQQLQIQNEQNWVEMPQQSQLFGAEEVTFAGKQAEGDEMQEAQSEREEQQQERQERKPEPLAQELEVVMEPAAEDSFKRTESKESEKKEEAAEVERDIE